MVAPVEIKPRGREFDQAVAGPLARAVVENRRDDFRGLRDGARIVPKSFVEGTHGARISEFVSDGHDAAAHVSPEVFQGLTHGGPTLTKRGVRL